MGFLLKPRSVRLDGDCHLDLVPDGDRPERYLVRFCGLDRDAAARAATQRARVRLMLAHLRGEAPFPSPLPARVIIGSLDRTGWHPGRSPLASALAEMESVRRAMAQMADDLMLRVALVAVAPKAQDPSPSNRGDTTD